MPVPHKTSLNQHPISPRLATAFIVLMILGAMATLTTIVFGRFSFGWNATLSAGLIVLAVLGVQMYQKFIRR